MSTRFTRWRDDLLRRPGSPQEELFEKLTAYYADDDNVTVIVDRRKSDRRNKRGPDGEAPAKADPELVKQREVRRSPPPARARRPPAAERRRLIQRRWMAEARGPRA